MGTTVADSPQVVPLAAALLAAVGTAGLPTALDDALRRGAAFDLTATLAFPERGPPILLHDGLGGISTPEVMRNYLGGTYLLDPVYTACVRRLAGGFYRVRELAPDAFFEGEYFNSPVVHPCISMQSGSLAEEVVFLAPISGGYITYSLMRSRGMEPFPDEQAAWLRDMAPLVVATLARQWGDRGRSSPQHASSGMPVDAIGGAISGFAHGQLSPREQAIVGLVLRGHSSSSIGQVLEITEGTVKNHRKHIHAKLGISSQSELFSRFVAHVLRNMSITGNGMSD